MAILELRGLKVLPPPDLDDGESLWIGPGAAQPRQCGGEGSGVLAGATDGGGRLLCRWSLADSEPRASVSREAQDGHQAIRRRSDSTKIK